MEVKEPCLNCPDKVIDEYGYFCDIVCGKNTAWENYQAGIKEVVEWLKGHSYIFIVGRDIEKTAASPNKESTSYYPIIRFIDWQSQLKKWGIE